jgi:hypothetical protein
MERQPSYGELAMLSDMFEQQCGELGVEWTDLEVKDEAYLDFCSQWIYGNDNPEVILCGYGYEQNTGNEKEVA